MRTGAGRLWLGLALASTPALGADGGPVSLSLTRAHTDAGSPAVDAPAADLDHPTLSIAPRHAGDSSARDDASEPADDSNDAAPLTDRAIAFDGGDDGEILALLSSERSPLELAPRLRIEFSRPTHLRDGGVSGSHAALSDERVSAFADDRGDIDLYNIAFRWDALSPGPLTFSLIGGMQAVSADIVSEVGEYDSSGRLVSTRLEDAYGIAPVPVVGGGVRWDVSDRFYISGAAQTHTIPDGASLLDVTAQTGLDISPTVGLRAGYQYLRTTVNVQDLDASLSVSGVFARLEIAF